MTYSLRVHVVVNVHSFLGIKVVNSNIRHPVANFVGQPAPDRPTERRGHGADGRHDAQELVVFDEAQAEIFGHGSHVADALLVEEEGEEEEVELVRLHRLAWAQAGVT